MPSNQETEFAKQQGLDKYGKPVMVFNTAGMYRGYKTEKSKLQIFIYK